MKVPGQMSAAYGNVADPRHMFPLDPSYSPAGGTPRNAKRFADKYTP